MDKETTSSEAKRARMTSQVGEESDRLSELPGHIIDQILSCLSIREAVRTSVLSSKWKYKWTAIPELVFDNRSTPPGCRFSKPCEWYKMVNEVLLFHSGPISKFVIAHKEVPPVEEVGRWISYLSRLKLYELVLDFSLGMCKLPSSMFSCQDLMHLRLCRCAVKPSSRLRVFKNLKTLELSHVEIASDVLEELISSCPLLEKISLICMPRLSNLYLNYIGPNVFEIEIGGLWRDDVGVNHRTMLAFVFYKEIRDERAQLNQRSKMSKLIANLFRVRNLSARKSQVKYWSTLKGTGKRYDKFLSLCPNLESLFLEIDFTSLKEISVALFLLRFPNLKEVQFSALSGVQETVDIGSDFWEGYRSLCSLPKLKFVSFTGIRGTLLEMGFIKFLLSQSHMLKRMEIDAAHNRGGLKLMTDLLAFERASPQAKLVYLGDHRP